MGEVAMGVFRGLDAKKPLDLRAAASFRDTYPSWVWARLFLVPEHPAFVGGEFYLHLYHECQLAAIFASSSAERRRRRRAYRMPLNRPQHRQLIRRSVGMQRRQRTYCLRFACVMVKRAEVDPMFRARWSGGSRAPSTSVNQAAHPCSAAHLFNLAFLVRRDTHAQNWTCTLPRYRLSPLPTSSATAAGKLAACDFLFHG